MTSGVVDVEGTPVAFGGTTCSGAGTPIVQAAPLMFVDDGTPSDDASRIAADRPAMSAIRSTSGRRARFGHVGEIDRRLAEAYYETQTFADYIGA